MRALVAVAVLAACADRPSGASPVDGVEELAEALADLSAQCTFSNHAIALVLTAGDIAWLAKGAGGAIEVNGLPCGAATAATTTSIAIQGGAGDQTVIVDFRGGAFAFGRAGTVGIAVALGGDAGDKLKVVGTPLVDRWTLGANGLSFDGNSALDLAFTGAALTVNLDDGDDTFSGAGDATTGAAFSAAVTIYGGAGNDTLRGGAGDDTVYGGDGDDTLAGGPSADGADTLWGGDGRDTADYAARSTNLAISLDDTANDGAAGEHDDVRADVEVVRGGSGNDTLVGGPNDDALYGGPGDDTLDGGGGNDALFGEAGNDLLLGGAAPNGADTFDGGPGIDTVSYAARTAGVSIILDGTATSGAAGEGDRIATTVENAIGGAGNDLLVGSAGPNVLDGGPGDDTIDGGAGDDVLRGGTGHNTLDGGAGDDRFDQGATALGDDVMHGGPGVDTVDYSARTQDLHVTMDGATTSGESGEVDRIDTDVENARGGSGDDTLVGNAGDNLLDGGPGSDALSGLAGDDVLDGGAGSDTLDCGAGEGDIALDATASLTGCEL